MDSPDSLLLTTYRWDTKTDLRIPIFDEPTRSILFSFPESLTAELTNNSPNYDIFIENLEEGGETRLSYQEKAILNDEDHPYPPMDYRLKVINKTTGKAYLCLYRIRCLSATNEIQYKDMVSTIGQYDENLLYEEDFKYFSGKRIFHASNRRLNDIFSLIHEHKGHILYSLHQIESNPLLKEKRVLVKTSIPKRQNAHAIIKEERSSKADSHYSSSMVQYADFDLNRYLIFMLRFSKIQLEELIRKADSSRERSEEKQLRILRNANPDPTKRKKHTNYQIDSLSRKMAILHGFSSDLRTILTFVEKVLAIDYFKNIEPSSKRDPSIVYHAHYFNLERRLYLPLYQGFTFSFSSNYQSILASPIKQTSKLFEAYCLFALDAAVLELGFEAVEEELDYERIVKRFVKDDSEIEIMYEIDAKDVSLANKDDVYYIVSGSRHVSPDFYLIVKKGDVPTCFMVFDAKCQRRSAIHSKITDPDRTKAYEKTIREYLSLRYSMDDNPFFFPKIVDSLWLLSPEDFDESTFDAVNKLEYRMVKLRVDGVEENFTYELGDFLLPYLDNETSEA